MGQFVESVGRPVGFYGLAIFTYVYMFWLSIKSLSFFRKESEKDRNDLALGKSRSIYLR
jgi:hypothetical protein